MMFTGLLRVVGSFFGLPIIFVKNTIAFLAKVGKEGFQSTAGDIPFLNWLLLAGRVLIVFIAALGTLVLAFIMASGGYRGFDFGEFLLGILLGVIGAFFWIWIAGLWLEMLSLGILIVNNTKQILDNLKMKGDRT